MSKTSEEVLLEEVQEELTAFLSSGQINEKELARTLSFEELNIKDFERLKEIHFVLSEPVTTFVRQLPDWIRRIKTESYREKKVSNGEIRGRIDWGETYKTRYSRNAKDKSLFVTQNPDIEYNIPENLVLKKVLGIIHRVVTKEVQDLDQDWREELWNTRDIDDLKQIFQRNVNIDRIKDMQDEELSSKQLDAARNSRREVYRKAYDLYMKYEKIIASEFSDEEVQKLLENTLVKPNDRPTLFELFATFKIIRNYEQEGLQLQMMKGENSEIALMKNEEKEVLVYHDSTGNLDFNMDFPKDPEDDFVKKSKEISEEHADALEDFIGRGVNEGLYSGRPDIIIEEYDTKGGRELEKVVIGEVKYTDKESTFSQGLRELLEYMKFGQSGSKDLEEFVLNGVIIADGIDMNNEDGRILGLNSKTLREGEFKIG
ncbi:MAG: hypothetical protein ABEJ95_03530 [Candidatus Nanohalobium sp.]